MATISSERSSSSSSSSFSRTRRRFDVFLSFRGDDTRHGFTDHLHKALIQRSIHVFRDSEKLQLGQVIASELIQAIEESQFAIIVFSEKYADSRWCLDELVEIVECEKNKGLTVVPVFYHVDPSYVRKQAGPFGKAFAEHDKDDRIDREKIQKWKNALREVGNLSGEHLILQQSFETAVIEDIVQIISKNLKGESVFKGLVGIESSEKEMMDLLKMELNCVRIIGMWGIGGVGKSTLARVIYCKISDEFEAKSFICFDSICPVGAQKQLLSHIFSEKEFNITSVDEGKQIIRDRLHSRKVLIVLDNVYEKSQLEAIAGSHDWFGFGSRIIITSRDKQLLTIHDVDEHYEAKTLDNNKALELFSLNAFKQPYPEKDFVNLSKDFVEYAQGLPLALEVFGRSLYKTAIDVWRSSLDELNENPNGTIVEKLEISYKKLDPNVRELFLDIAFFFKGMDKDRVKDILGSPGYLANIDNLKNRSLITILGGKLWMHDLLQEMGREIVRREELGRRRWLWNHEDFFSIVSNTGTINVKCMILETLPQKEDFNANTCFSKMKRLQLIKISNVLLPQGLDYISNELRMMEWHDYPLKSMPRSFRPNNLVELIMPHSHIEQLPEGFSNLDKLKHMDLSFSRNFIKTPNFIGFRNLETLIFQGCTRLYKVHPSMGALKRLTFLNLQDCKCLKSLPHEIKLEDLKVFILSGCSRLKKLSEFGENMTHLSELYLEGTAIEELPSSINHLVGLTILNLKDCKHLSSFPTAICNLTSLEILTIHGCRFQQPKPWHLPGLFPVLSTIGVTLTVLWTCCFFYAQHPEPEPINLLLPMSFSELRSLKSLDLSDCNLSDGALPDDLSCLSSLQSLNLSKNNFTRLPDSISQLSKLKLLCLDNCSKLQSMPYPPLSTKYVMARGCTLLQNYSNEVDVWTSGDTGFTFIDYRSLPEDDFSLDSLLEDHSSKITELSLPDIYFKPLWQKSMEDHIRENDDFYIILHRIETLEWFHHPSSTGSFVRIPLPEPNNELRGLALFMNFEIHRHLNEVSPGQDAVYFHEFICRLDDDCSVVYKVPRAKIHVGSFGLWLYISQAKFGGLLDGRDFIRPSIEINILDVQIKECGARILYEEDVLQFVQHLSQQIFGSPDDFRQLHEDLIKNAMGNPQNCNDEPESSQSITLIDPNHRLRVALKSLLSRLYEVDYAPYHTYDYIFPRIEIPPSWFNNQNLVSYIKTDCPPNLHDNSTWMGVAVYAFYTVDEQQAGLSYKQDSIIFLRLFSLSSSCEVTLVPFIGFSLSRDIFVDSSPRLLVFYIPRKQFVLNQFSHIRASFESNNRGVKFEMCGIRLIFEQDLEGFIQTLVQCMLEMPDAYHPSLYQNLLAQLAQFQDCDHDTGLCSSSSSERRPRTMPTLLPSIENVPEESYNSSETFLNEEIAVGTGNSSPSAICLGIPFGNGKCESTISISMLESVFKAHIQGHYDNGGIFNNCFPQTEIPQWFHPQSDGPSVTIHLPQNLFDDPDWMGFAFCAAFQFHKHPTAIRTNLGSGSFRHRFMCVLDSNIGRSSQLFDYTIVERDVLISLRGRAFIWVSFLPSVKFAPQWGQSTWVRFWFRSDSPDLSARKYCGVNLVYRKNLEDFTRTVVQCYMNLVNFLFGIRNSCYEEDVYKILPIYHDEEISESHKSDQDIHHQRLPNSQAETSDSIQFSFEEYCFHPYKTGPADFHPLTLYNFCFPPSTSIHEWFTHRRLGHSVTIDLPPNLYLDIKWTGLVMYAFFSIQGHPLAILEIMKSGIPHHLYAQFQMSTGDLDDIILGCHGGMYHVTYLYNLGGFIWISYLPGEIFKDVLQLCSDMEASFVSEWPGVIVKKCGLRLLYQRDLEQFRQKLKHCEALHSGYQDSLKQFTTAQEKKEMQDPINEQLFVYKAPMFRKPSHPLDTDETETQPGEGDFLDFDGCSVCNSYCPPREILYWFSHSSVAPTVTIDVPKDLYGYNDWMGLILCAYFSCHEDHITDFENFNSKVSHHLICLLETDIGDPEQLLHIHSTTYEEFTYLEVEDEFLWLSFIPRWWFQDRLGQSSCLKASITSDWPGLMVHKCGLRFFHLLDNEEFERIIFRCHATSKNREFNEVNNKVETNRVEDELCENHPHTRDSRYQSQDFDSSLVYNSCFPPSEHLEWFESWSGGPQVTIPLPINLYNDKAWFGLALCASFEVDVNKVVVLEIEDSKISYNLICNLGAGIKCVEPLRPYRLTKKDLKLLQLGGFVWLYYIPRGSFQDSLNQCSRIEASIETNCPGLTVQKCWFLLLYQRHELEFKETIRHMASFRKEDENPLHKDKGKRVLE